MGYVGSREAGPLLIEGLRRLEYRGYDSAGLAVLEEGGPPQISKNVGKLANLVATMEGAYPAGGTGIAHTRWATHGRPDEHNAHPLTDCTGDVVVVHNGIVENYVALKRELEAAGHRFASETDTEVIPHLIEAHLGEGDDLVEALRRAIERIEGAHAIVVMRRQEPGRLAAARVGNAGGVVLGYGQGEMFVASDLPALLPETRSVVFLADQEVAEITKDGASYRSAEGREMEKTAQTVPIDPMAAAKGAYKHFMLKEIMEQPDAVLDTFRGQAVFDPPGVELEGLDGLAEPLRRIQRAMLVAMGTSLHAAMLGRYYLEAIAGIPSEVDNASEFRYRSPLVGPETLVISVAQSGETVDTLEAMSEARRRGALQITVCNTPGSQATRIADATVHTRCGLEIGVASTKTLTGSITALYLLACHLGQLRGRLDQRAIAELVEPLAHMPALIGRTLGQERQLADLAHRFFRCQNFLYLGRGIQYPVAMEGALKLKEVSYIHAEGYPAGEMKHGPIALIDRDMPVVAIAMEDSLRDKMLSNIEQVKARDGVVIAVGTEGDDELARRTDHVIHVPQSTSFLSPMLTVVPMQLLAYHIAVWRGCDVDQPRNLAKTVTVE
jgi:glucosamine--fructose-6-phosphate aminotransferase (isomerizing)